VAERPVESVDNLQRAVARARVLDAVSRTARSRAPVVPDYGTELRGIAAFGNGFVSVGTERRRGAAEENPDPSARVPRGVAAKARAGTEPTYLTLPRSTRARYARRARDRAPQGAASALPRRRSVTGQPKNRERAARYAERPEGAVGRLSRCPATRRCATKRGPTSSSRVVAEATGRDANGVAGGA